MSGEKKSIGIGILGAAAIARKNIRGISQARNGVEVVAIGSRNLDRGLSYAKEVGLDGKAKVYGSYAEVLDDPAVDAVYLPLPTSLHVEWVKKAAAKGKHILLEKPIALTPEDADEIVRTCESAGVQLMDGTMWVHNARTALMQKEFGRLGQLRTITTSFSFAGDANFMANDIRVKKGLDGLGCLGDLGWYNIGVSLWAAGYDKPASVTALPGLIRNDDGVLMHVTAVILWQDGRRAILDCGFDSAFTQDFKALGFDGTLGMSDFVIPKTEKSCGFSVAYEGSLADDATVVTTKTDTTVVNFEVPQETQMWEDFADCVRAIQAGGKPNGRWPEISSMTQKVVCAVDESAANGCKTVELKW